MIDRTEPRTGGRASPVLFAALAVVAFAMSAVAEPPVPDAYAPGKVWQVHLTLSAEEYAAIEPRSRGFLFFGPAQKPLDPGREVHRNDFGVDLPWAVGEVTVGDQAFGNVGIRYKGNGTIGDAGRSVKKSFKIDLDRAGGSGRFAGSKTINLHCGVADPTKCRETLGYQLYRSAGVPAPRTVLAEVRITVPGKHDKELLGLYTIVEEVDKPFLRARFGDGGGLLLKPDQLRDFTFRGDDWARYKATHRPNREPTTDEAKRLIAFAHLVSKADDATFEKEVASYLDVDGYLRFLATTAFVANVDSFFNTGHNYYVYLHPKTGKLHFLPWDLDRAFANLGNPKQNLDLSLTRPYFGTHRLTERLLALPGVEATYLRLLKDLAAGPFAAERCLKELAALEEVLKEPRDRDAKAAADRKERVAMPFGAPPDLATFFKARAESVAAQLEGRSKGYVPRWIFGLGEPAGGSSIHAG